MGAIYKAAEYAFVDTTAVSLTTALALSAREFIGTVLFRAAAANVSNVHIGTSNLTATTNRGGFMEAGDGLAFDLDQKFISSDDVFLQGAASDIVHMSWVQ